MLIIIYITKKIPQEYKNKISISSITIFIDDNIKEKQSIKNIGDEIYFLINKSSKREIHIQFNK